MSRPIIYTHEGLHAAWRMCVAAACPVARVWMKGIRVKRMDYDGPLLDRVETETHSFVDGRFKLKDSSRKTIMDCLHQIAPNCRWVHVAK